MHRASETNLETAAYQLGKKVSNTGNQWALNWYQSELEEAQRRLVNLGEAGMPTFQPATNGSREDATAPKEVSQPDGAGWKVDRRHPRAANNQATVQKGKEGPNNRNAPSSNDGSNTERPVQPLPTTQNQRVQMSAEDEIMKD